MNADGTGIEDITKSPKSEQNAVWDADSRFVYYLTSESGKMQLVETDYKLSSVLNDVSNMIFFKARDKGLDFGVDVDKNIPDGLHGDEVRVRQIITNILNNAVKYTKEGSVHLKVRGEEIKDTSVRTIALTITVSDTGIGIKEEDIGKLFTKFERVDLEQNSTVEGTGLGLAITKNLLQMMGGHIDVHSVYTEGSIFTIYLPQLVVSDEPVGDFRRKFDESIQAMEVYEESFHAPDANILIVDDTKMNLIVVEGLLKDTGLKIDTATSGADSIALSREKKYDIILMDQRMPGMDGTEAMNHIKAESGINSTTPFICLTADAISGAKERYMKAGFTDYLTKPIDYKALEKMLIKYLPSEKVLVNLDKVKEEIRSIEKGSVSEKYEQLVKDGIDTDVGLAFCKFDADFYNSILNDYVTGYEERYGLLRMYFEAEDWKNYGIYAHSLKSASKTIGASELSELAASLEKAADENNADEIKRKHAPMLKLYENVKDSIVKCFPEFEPESEDSDDIMEFAPNGGN